MHEREVESCDQPVSDTWPHMTGALMCVCTYIVQFAATVLVPSAIVHYFTLKVGGVERQGLDVEYT